MAPRKKHPRGFPPAPKLADVKPITPADTRTIVEVLGETVRFGPVPTEPAPGFGETLVGDFRPAGGVVVETVAKKPLEAVADALSVMPDALVALSRGETPVGAPGGHVLTDEDRRVGRVAAGAKRRRMALITGLGVSKNSPLFTDERVAAYAKLALEYAEKITQQFASEFGSGVCSPTAALEIISACRAMLWAAWATDRFDVEEAMKAGTVMSKHFENAKRICIEEAEWRRKNSNESAADKLANSFSESADEDPSEDDEDADIPDGDDE